MRQRLLVDVLRGRPRFLIGDVALGIHGPRTPDAQGVNAAALEASAYRTAAALMMLLKDLGVESEDVRRLFIQIPASTMLWIHPKYFEDMPGLIVLATNYVDFHGFTAENPLGSVGG